MLLASSLLAYLAPLMGVQDLWCDVLASFLVFLSCAPTGLHVCVCFACSRVRAREPVMF